MSTTKKNDFSSLTESTTNGSRSIQFLKIENKTAELYYKELINQINQEFAEQHKEFYSPPESKQ